MCFALADAHRVDRLVVREHLAREGRGVRAADHDVGARMYALDLPGEEGDATAVRGPARQAEDLGVERVHNLLDAPPREGREVHDLHLVAGTERLRAQGEQAVGRLVEVGVEVALRVLGGRTFSSDVGRFAGHRDFPGWGVQQSDAHLAGSLL